MAPPTQRDSSVVEEGIARLREATRNTEYEGKLYLVGGVLRDRNLAAPSPSELDIVLEGDAAALARFLFKRGVCLHRPVTYPRFGTAMVQVAADSGVSTIEIVTARAEDYAPDSRKPDVRPAALRDDAFRRDFTINTLMENLHTGEALDLTGLARDDLQAGIIRTPVDAHTTFRDDPLRMLRAARFAARFGFAIADETRAALHDEVRRLAPPTVSYERIRDEFVLMVGLPGAKARDAMRLLADTGLLAQFLPEMLPMAGCAQNDWHSYDVWTHTLVALEQAPADSTLEVRLGILWHDIGKPATRTVDATGTHFYGHQKLGADMARAIMTRLRFGTDQIRDVTSLVALHMRLGEYKPDWTDPTVRRLIRDCGDYRDDLFTLARCDIAAASIDPARVVDLDALRERIDGLNAMSDVARIRSPLDGNELMALLGVGPGPHLRLAKDFLVNEIIEGRLVDGDRDAAAEAAVTWWRDRGADTPAP